MRFTSRFPFARFCLLMLLMAATLISAQAQTSSFSYQGKLDDGGNPANGAYDFEFRLFDTLSGGAQIGSTVTVNDLNVATGIFTATLDFGAAAFPGANRWLQISVRLGTSSGAYTTLSPRQQIASVPYAIKSLNAAAADGLSATCVNCITSGQINTINSTQINGTITGSQISVPLSLSGSSSPVVSATNTGTGTALYGNSTTSTGVGVYGQNSSNAGNAIYGAATSLTGTSIGVHGVNNSTDGTGVKGSATSTTGFNYGVTGQTASPDGIGVFGNATSATGSNIGVGGRSDSVSGTGIYGVAFSTTGTNYGVEGHSKSNAGRGVFGRAESATGTTFGVYGQSSSVNGTGVFGVAPSSTGLTQGVYGRSNSNLGVGLYGEVTSNTGNTVAVFGVSTSTSGHGVTGYANANTGSAIGVIGISNSTSGTGVYGTVTASGATATNPTSGVWGDVNGFSRVGVRASNAATGGAADGLLATTASANGYAIYAINSFVSASKIAGTFDGNVQIVGNLTKSSGTFKIDHPLDPKNKYLYHSFVESPEMMNIYNGNVMTDAEGQATVSLPEWFEALNRDFRYQLTVIGTFAQAIVAEEISGNSFKIKTSAPNVKVSWQVTGVRQDAYANKHRIKVEEDKPTAERGTYLHPDVFGQPEEKGVNWARNPGLMKELKESRERSLRGEPESKSALPTARRGNQ